MKFLSLIVTCALASFTAPAFAEDTSTVFKEGNGLFSQTRYYYVPIFQSWCINLNGGNASWGGCIPEYAIPPENLRQLRIKAGLDPNLPVFKP